MKKETKWALETVLEFAEKWADSKRRDREAFDEAAPILRAALSSPPASPTPEAKAGCDCGSYSADEVAAGMVPSTHRCAP